ncbi:uncharacterized protein LOC131057042 [Cryptomeria japonica]|uniref:uncharacterized protein LOC131057042 n=1 Tax=Cryptomeria japonica TaxID=3369 RepID=UPI0025AB5D9E|nr:uncharacterized protein LOC131057042 [Cryptomeria japonica]
MYEHYEDSWTGPWRLLEEIVLLFQMIYVGKHFGELSKKIADRILAYASEESDAFSLLYSLLEVNGDYPSHFLSNFVLTDVVTDEEDSKHFSKWEDTTHSCVESWLTESSFYSELHNMTIEPQDSNEKLLRTLISSAESRTSAVFLRNYIEKVGVDQLRGKTVLLLISLIDEHPFESLKEIY